MKKLLTIIAVACLFVGITANAATVTRKTASSVFTFGATTNYAKNMWNASYPYYSLRIINPAGNNAAEFAILDGKPTNTTTRTVAQGNSLTYYTNAAAWTSYGSYITNKYITITNYTGVTNIVPVTGLYTYPISNGAGTNNLYPTLFNCYIPPGSDIYLFNENEGTGPIFPKNGLTFIGSATLPLTNLIIQWTY
jgi:hypothetical protein